MTRRWRRRSPIVLPLGIALFVFLGWLGRRDVVTSHEARVGQTARVMAASGWPWAANPAEAASIAVRANPDGTYAVPRFDLPPMEVNPWLVPILNGQARLQKPPLPNWCAATLYRLFGVSEFATRIVPALFAALGTLLVADLARFVLGRSAAPIAALIWASTIVILSEFREATADPYLAFFALCAVSAWVRASERPQVDEAVLAPLLLAFYASLGLGVLAKGPFIFVHVGIALLAYALCCQRRRPHATLVAHILGVFLMLAIALPWPIYIATSVEDALGLWKLETTRGGGASVGTTIATSWQYLPRLFDITLPWTPTAILGVIAVVRGRFTPSPRRRRRWFALIWCAATVFVFSLAPEKKNAYLLPMMPALVLLIAAGALALRTGLRMKRATRWMRILAIAQAVVGIAIVIVAVSLLAPRAGPTAVGAMVVIGGSALVLMLLAARHATQNRARQWFTPHAVGSALACLLLVGFAHAATDNERSAKPFARLAAPVMIPPANTFVPGLLAEAAFYLPLEVHYDPRADTLYYLVEPPRGRKIDATTLRPKLPHGRVIDANLVDLPGEGPNAHWRLVRLTVDPTASPAAPQ